MAKRRIMREFEDLEINPLLHASVSPSNDGNTYKWIGIVTGPDETPYQDGIFILNIQFPMDYPFKSPKVTFITPIYHPNINAKGNICLELLKGNDWSPALTIRRVLLYIVSVLVDPNPYDPLIPEIANLYKRDYAKFEKIAREWTQRYAI